MRKSILLLCVILVLPGCIRQQQSQNVNKGLHVIRAAILQTAKVIETAHDNQVISDDDYMSAKVKTMMVVKRYNVLLDIGNPSPEQLQVIIDDLSAIRKRFQ